ncbi:alkyl hydroperoxide reductase/ Thiol specific antioxidant/ Mal allergen [Paenibacillus curdlanolyticus YK9]|uniref:thioredoxin-dependent peroxiredoxin n=1 Tax=Paenibacillus curdlanolyticus YK9 TaxID=717606 RepID=E0I2Y8_9BACL|nr:peroxiredoxin [Paenibacillus curdlanolyticus]EFM12652.1 alkyl hydroperoxide reductase/ Thiol specific antioxidant/ Mal allergen [Paenibacillus curdlanolyticus YK9]
MLTIGSTAPLFEANSTQGIIKLSDYVGKQPIVLIFYPMDETPGCTKQLCAVRDSRSLYARYNALVMGVNPSTLEHHQQFAERQGYDFPLIVDAGGEIRKAFGVGKLLGLFAQQRVVFIIGQDGRIVFAEKGNRPTEEILEALQALQPHA